MSEITRKKLAKGTKLQAQPVNDFFDATQTAIRNRTLNKENVPYESTFELNYSIDCIRWAEAGDQAWTFPFILPETQDKFSTQQQEDTTSATLRSIVLSTDQGDEPIVWRPEADQGDGTQIILGTSEGDAGIFSIKLAIFKKTPTVVESNLNTWEQELLSYDVPGLAFAVNNMSTNPFVIKDINKQFPPDSAYCLSFSITFERGGTLAPGGRVVLLKNTQISLKFSTPLRVRDTQAGDDDDPTGMANSPVLYGSGADSQDTISLGTINPGDTIQEDPLQTNIEQLDDKLQKKMSGGYSSTWSKPDFAEQLDIQAYEAFVVPLFNNDRLYMAYGLDMTKMPYTQTSVAPISVVPDGDPGTVALDQVFDRRIIPINNAFEVHHIFLCYQGRTTTGPQRDIANRQEGTTSVLQNVGDMVCYVSIGSGWNSDWYGVQNIVQVSESDWNDFNVVDQAVDPLTQNDFRNIGFTTTRIQQLPLNFEAAGTNSEGIGYFDNGIPVFVGRGVGYNSNDRTNHTNTPGIGPIAPNTRGQEKYINFVLGWTGLPYTNELSNYNAGDLLANGGAHLLIIGKKSLARSEW